MSDWNPGTHANPSREPKLVTASRSHVGKFGRMFRELPEAIFDEAYLKELATVMASPPPGPGLPQAENPKIAAGYTYFGQFIGHDLSFDPSSLLEKRNDPDSLVDFRTPRFDLDSVYGRGPAEQRYMYQEDGSFVLGTQPDLPRTTLGRAIVPDPRNDENRMVSQLHAAFMLLHNRLMLKHRNFNEAQREARWHYQWLVLNDYLPKLVPTNAIKELLIHDEYVVGQRGGRDVRVRRARPKLRYFNPHTEAFMPVEFSAAAFRFGHSMVRPAYALNDAHRAAGTQVPLFGSPGQDLRGFSPLTPDLQIQWGYFFPWGANPLAQSSLKLDEHLAPPLGVLPSEVASRGSRSLAQRTLTRGLSLGLPSGPDVARLLGIEPMKDEILFDDVGLRGRFKNSAPLWYYILREANVYSGGEHLGPVGGTIVAETVIGLLWNDAQSYLRIDPTWQPPTVRDMAGLLRSIGAPL